MTMGQVSRVLRRTQAGWAHWCPGCDEMHVIPDGATGPKWSFDGNLEKPTFSPSVRHSWNWGPHEDKETCHYFLTAGVLCFCADSTHKLAGQNVPLPEFPKLARQASKAAHWGVPALVPPKTYHPPVPFNVGSVK